MPNAPLRPCPGCRRSLVRSGKCADCAKATEQHRGSAAKRGYGSQWQRFRERYITELVNRGIVPQCGARLPEGPTVNHSQCEKEGAVTLTSADGSSLHLNHEPPLRDDERLSVYAVCRPERIELLCHRCHMIATEKGQDEG